MLSRLVVFVSLVTLATPAGAQPETVKPYVLLLFDTSGSMRETVCGGTLPNPGGDNSAECPGPDLTSCGGACNQPTCDDGLSNDTRLYKVKKGATSVVGAFGEVIFALARFHQAPQSFDCNAGGWYGAPAGCDSDAMNTGWNRADLLVAPVDGNQNDILQWMNNCDDYPLAGACPWGVDPDGKGGRPLTPGTGCSLCPSCGGGCDKELRGEGYTPIAGSLNSIRQYLDGPLGLDSDPKADCRPYKIILLTDGQDNCPGNPVTEAQALYGWTRKQVEVRVIGFAASGLKDELDAIARGGSGNTKDAVIVEDETSLALAMASIISESLLTEKCNDADDDCDGECDESFPEVAVTNAACSNNGRAAKTCTAGIGICARTGAYTCLADGSGSSCSVTPGPPNPGGEICGNGLDDDCDGQIDEGCVPCVSQPEVCDGKDNDCDGQIDEGYVSVPCGSDIGACAAGTTACQSGQVVCNGATPPTTELCDNIDNNCDTIVDYFTDVCYPAATVGCTVATGVCQGLCRLGTNLCTNGTWGPCLDHVGPSTEVCNGLDDDCDGETDEGVSNSCTDFSDCSGFASCQACPATPAEVCDGKDNDCNGQIDDDPTGVGGLCGSGVGECARGTWVCENGALVCQGESAPTPEVCDGKDNDCNGAIDDKVPGEGQPCGSDVGECESGTTKCVAGKIACVGGTQPMDEICDGKDNDCDGEADEAAECPGGSACIAGRCVLPCTNDEFACPGGMSCIDGYCLPDACVGVVCKPDERCLDGECVDRCAGVTCDAHEKCNPDDGQCSDDSCVSKGCPAGQACVDYACVETGCKPDTCPDNQQCFAGECFASCLNKKCPAGQSCVQGSCTDDPCAAKDCPVGQSCTVQAGEASCAADPCYVINCAPGQACIDAKCVGDPCAVTLCPAGQRCVLSVSHQPSCAEDPSVPQGTTRRVLAAGSGGFSCAVGAEPGGPPPDGALALLLLGVVIALRRRRR